MAEIITEVQNIVIDKVQVINFVVNAWPPQQRAIGINYAVGYEDAEGNFIPVGAQKQLGIQGEEFDRVTTIQADGNLNLYENIKTVLYAEL